MNNSDGGHSPSGEGEYDCRASRTSRAVRLIPSKWGREVQQYGDHVQVMDRKGEAKPACPCPSGAIAVKMVLTISIELLRRGPSWSRRDAPILIVAPGPIVPLKDRAENGCAPADITIPAGSGRPSGYPGGYQRENRGCGGEGPRACTTPYRQPLRERPRSVHIGCRAGCPR